MGTQQILLIVLSVIIVGVAIAVGISMFSSQAYNSNKQAVAAELANYATQVLQYWKTPASLGGAGSKILNLNVTSLATFIGLTDANNSITSGNGEFRLIGISGTTVTLKGLGKEEKGGENPLVTTSINVATDSIGTVIGTGTNF